MAISTKPNDTYILNRAIEDAVRKETEAEFHALKQQLIEKLDRERDTIIAGVTLNVMKLVSFETMKDNLIITVRKQETPTN